MARNARSLAISSSLLIRSRSSPSLPLPALSCSLCRSLFSLRHRCRSVHLRRRADSFLSAPITAFASAKVNPSRTSRSSTACSERAAQGRARSTTRPAPCFAASK
eukprot:CAMPEP_0177745908 /NCGR_PEP_ID=MMETSP0484_2-20121128/30567_1 /TAXON_ID=354590 /ORGANISM="Rhodomonas lens, Strain RHODO" /LENGTH=104 /DNA_ID=CAMNT_0019260583 /DNA_START=416 /DNA_END=727 /DNA_ORIENTATION=-